jgi:hypothetical protein
MSAAWKLDACLKFRVTHKTSPNETLPVGLQSAAMLRNGRLTPRRKKNSCVYGFCLPPRRASNFYLTSTAKKFSRQFRSHENSVLKKIVNIIKTISIKNPPCPFHFATDTVNTRILFLRHIALTSVSLIRSPARTVHEAHMV